MTCTYLAKRLRELSSTKTGSYPHEFLCRTNCSACADYQPCTCTAGINEIFICDDTFNDSCLFENDTSFDFQNFGSNNFISLEIDEIANFDINLDFLNDISFCENDANCTNLVNSTFIKIIDQFSETNVEAIVNGTDVDNSNEYEPNQNLSNSNSEENLLYYNDTSVNSNHVVVDVNKSIVCNEIETSVGNVNFKYDFNMLNILTGTCGQDPPPFFLNIDFFFM